jgi:phytoene dehydrogenase-like protein
MSSSPEKYDAIIIGAGMSGLAAGIRLAMFDKKVVILEKHVISGGLNSYYSRFKKEFDVGLHAMTNFVPKGTKGRPLTKLLKQLRFNHEDFKLNEQTKSKILFGETALEFNNDISFFEAEIRARFPHEVDNFIRLKNYIIEFDDVSLDNPYQSAKAVVETFIKDSLLTEMIFAPLLIYGSAWERDMDFSQFAIMFKSLYLEGFARPNGGVRVILNLLMNRFKELGGELRFRSEVTEILTENNKAYGVKLKHIKTEETLYSDKIFSSMGLPETLNITPSEENKNQTAGMLSFTENIFIAPEKPKDLGLDNTIIFYNEGDEYFYERPKTLFDPRSSVVCLPNNFSHDEFNEGWYRFTHIANFDLWQSLISEDGNKDKYKEEKMKVAMSARELLKKLAGGKDITLEHHDGFTPLTVKKYTGHFNGAVYGSTAKTRDGKTNTEGLYIIGTDQGFLGIIGSMLSGISLGNLYGLMD